MSSRIEALEKLLARNPQDSRVRFGLAAEYEKAGRWDQVAIQLEAYLAEADDQGNAWGRLARALRQLGRDAEARSAYARGIEAARRHGHPSMAAEFEAELEEV
jgi:predicted Zn-dependent protease